MNDGTIIDDIVVRHYVGSHASNCVRIIEHAAAHLGIDPAVLADRLAALQGGGIGELVDAATPYSPMGRTESSDSYDTLVALTSALKPFEKD